MTDILKNNKLSIALILLIVIMLLYHFLYMTKEKAAYLILKESTGIDWDAGYLKGRARAMQKKKDTFKYKGSEYDTQTGKKIA